MGKTTGPDGDCVMDEDKQNEQTGTLVTTAEAAATGKLPREAAERDRQLLRLRNDLATLHEAMARVRAETTHLAQLEAVRRLTKVEATRARDLRMESQSHYLQLQRLRQEFEALRSEGQRRKTAG